MTTLLEEFADDPEILFSLQERGRSGGHGGRTDTGAGDRAVAERSRISGLDQLRPMLTHLPDAMRAGGWDEKHAVGVTVGPDTHDDAPGRDWSLRGAIAEAKMTVPVHGTPDHDAAEAALHDTGTSEEAVFFESEGGSLIVYIRYISDGFAANASSELAVELRAAGYTVTEV